ncbi:MAG: dipeptidase PepE [Acidobacteriota bacterium]
MAASVRLLLLSNSTNPGEPYLGWSLPHIQRFLAGAARRVLFVPFAGVRITWEDYTAKVRGAFAGIGVEVAATHEVADPAAALGRAEGLVVGGGNTFHLLRLLRASGLLEAAKKAVGEGMPYVGWSAGANVACPTIMTTNDMPIVDPLGLDALGLVPFQINPHFTEAVLPGHGGESREERILEFLEAHPEAVVVGLREGSLLRREGGELRLEGIRGARLFRRGSEAVDLAPGSVLSGLLA